MKETRTVINLRMSYRRPSVDVSRGETVTHLDEVKTRSLGVVRTTKVLKGHLRAYYRDLTTR
jgi:hypothetical protein